MEVNPGLTSPRVNLKVMNKYRGLSSPVRFVGKVLRLTQEMLVLEAPDGGQVNVIVTPDVNVTSEFVEIVGTVQPDGTIFPNALNSFGNNFDMENYNALVELIHSQYHELFI